jgi:hypothetical protein
MKLKSRIVVASIGLVALGFGLPSFGQGTPVSVSITGVSGDPIVTVGGEEVYAGVYGGISTLAGANPGIICDDFNDEVYVPETWTATAYQVSTLGTTTPISDVLFGGSYTSHGYTNVGIAGYAELAYLVNQMVSTTNTATQGDLSEAIWSITDPGLSGVDTNAQNFVSAAQTYASSTHDSMSQYSNLWVYTPSPNTGEPGEAQEMWGSVPEGGAAALYLLLAAACFFAAVLFRSSRHSQRDIA